MREIKEINGVNVSFITEDRWYEIVVDEDSYLIYEICDVPSRENLDNIHRTLDAAIEEVRKLNIANKKNTVKYISSTDP